MNIKDAETLSGVSRRNIRFYEQKGLLTPDRNRENDYREYTQADIERLKLIRALRMLDMPLEQILEITQGRLSLRIAVAEQKEKLKQQIKRLETAVCFCEEFEKTQEPDINAVLTKMDEPENRKQLAKSWPQDYAERIWNILLPVGASFLPFVGNGLFAQFGLLLILVFAPIMNIYPVLFLCGWALLGYYFYSRGKWWRSAALIHVVPVVIYGLDFWQSSLPGWQRSDLLREIILLYSYPFAFGSGAELGSAVKLMLMAASFCMGGLIAWGIHRIRSGREKSPRNSGRVYTVPPKLFILCAVLVLPLILSVIWLIFRPLPYIVTTEALDERLSSGNTVWVETEYVSYAVAAEEEFGDRFRFEEWERKYYWTSTQGPELTVHISGDRTEPYVVEFYSNDTVRVYEAWMTVTEGYYTVPDGVMETILDYADVNGAELMD